MGEIKHEEDDKWTITLTNEDKLTIDLRDDYKLKVDYLKNHFSRMWTRFNYFLGLETALLGASFLALEKYHKGIPILGIALSMVWFIFAVKDRGLVKYYRKQIELVWEKIKPFQNSEISFTGDTQNSYISITKMPIIFSFLFLGIWVIVLCTFPLKTAVKETSCDVHAVCERNEPCDFKLVCEK